MFTWPSKRDGSQFHKHQLTAGESRTLCGQRVGDWLRGELESPDERCPKCDAAAENMGKREVEQTAPTAMMLTTRSAMRKAMSRADWALTAWYAAGTDAEIVVAGARVRTMAATVDALYGEFSAMLATAGEQVVA